MNITRKVGRPTDYTRELAEEICNAIACSSKGIKRLCKENEHWPCSDTIFHWRKHNKEFSDLYARAKETQVEALVDDILEIADDTANDYVIKEDGNIAIDHEHIQRAKLKIDTRKWLAAKLCPRLYGDKLPDIEPQEPLLVTFMKMRDIEAMEKELEEKKEILKREMLKNPNYTLLQTKANENAESKTEL